MKINGNELRPGMVIEYDGGLWVAVKSMAVKPGKGPAYNQVELKNLIDGRKLNNRFGSDERVERARLEHKDYQYLYRQSENLVFMDMDTYEQIELHEDFVGERAAFLQDGMKVTLEMHEERPIGIQLAGAGHAPGRGGGRRHQRADGLLVLQAGEARERASRHGASVRCRRRKDRRRHERGHLRSPRRVEREIPPLRRRDSKS